MTPGQESTTVPAPTEPRDIPEHVVVLLLEGGQRFLAKADEAIRRQDPQARDFHLRKVLAILEELNRRLDPVRGGELVINLSRIYDWWGREISEAGATDAGDRLKLIAAQMGEIRRSWEHVLFKGEGLSEGPNS